MFEDDNGENLLVLMVQAPGDIFAYWEISPDFIEMAVQELQGVTPELYLRLYREAAAHAPGLPCHVFPRDLYRGSAYFHGLVPYHAYCAELGLSYGGGFFTLLRSDPAMTPPAKPVPTHKPSQTKASHLIPPLPGFAYSPADIRRGGSL